MEPPSGTITLLFTDIEGSTKLWEAHPEAMGIALARHDALLREAIEVHAGLVFKTIGDAFCAAFATAPEALAAALTAQLALAQESWPEPITLKVRMALHTGAVESRDKDYFGLPLNLVARLLATAHGKQTLLTQATQEQVRESLPLQVTLRDLGTHQLKDIAQPEQIYQLQHPDLANRFPPLKSLSTHPNNLPQQATSFIGREKELTDIETLLANTRLLTLTGSGGSGKSRLSLQLATNVLERFPDGAFLVELAPLSDPGFVTQTVASVLGLKEESGKTVLVTLTEYLRDKTLLLLLDNCEHILDSSAKLVDTLIKTCPHIHVITTSREGLGIVGESTYRIPSFSIPDPTQTQTAESILQYDAVRLFIDRAVQIQPHFTITNENASALASICFRLDGIPLAIELAAARARSLSAEEINNKLDQRFRLLTGGPRTALPRQQTLRSLIDWSYDLLTSQEKQVFKSLSVFAGGWTLEAAESLCVSEDIEEWEVLDYLTSLCDKSLALAEQKQGRTRFRYLETVRQYARERLLDSGEGEAVRESHREYFLALAEEAEPKLIGPEQTEWFERLEEEHENLRVSLEGSLSATDPLEALRFCGALNRFWSTRGHLSEGRSWCLQALEKPGAEARTRERASTLHGAGLMTFYQGNYPNAKAYQEESLEISRERGDKAGIASSLIGLGLLALTQGDYAIAKPYLEESLGISRERGNKYDIARSLSNLGIVANYQGNYPVARTYHAESLGIQREIQDKAGIAQSLSNLGNVASNQADYSFAKTYLEESVVIFQELGNKLGIVRSLNNLGLVTSNQCDYAVAQTCFQESLRIAREIGNKTGIAQSLGNLGTMVYSQGDYPLSRAYHEESLAIRQEIGDKFGIASALNNLGSVALRQGDYPSARTYIEKCLVLCRELGSKNGIAVSLLNLGSVALKQNDESSAQAYLDESIMVFQEIGNKFGLVNCLVAFGSLASQKKKVLQAVTLWGGSEALREQIGAPLSRDDRESTDKDRAAARAALNDDGAFDAAWQEGRALTLEQAIALARETSS